MLGSVAVGLGGPSTISKYFDCVMLVAEVSMNWPTHCLEWCSSLIIHDKKLYKEFVAGLKGECELKKRTQPLVVPKGNRSRAATESLPSLRFSLSMTT